MADPIQEAVDILRGSRNLMVLTGAGISHESGIPTFRGKDGLWNRYDPRELASIDALRRDPVTVWEWYNWRRSLIRAARPNPAHEALAKLERLKSPGYLLVTQNVDGLHKRAGSRALVEVHGNIFLQTCLSCGRSSELDEVAPTAEIPPRCGVCGGALKPGVVLFGEMLPLDALARTMGFAARAGEVLVVGTSAAVYPVAAIPFGLKEKGARVVEVNTDETPISQIADVSIRAAAGEVLPEIVRRLQAAPESATTQ